jgi:hypothetical protein
MKETKKCRFCGRVIALRNDLGKREYKAVHFPHKCPHGCDCLGGQTRGKGFNWPALYLGNPPRLAFGCPTCYKVVQTMEKFDKLIRDFKP